MSCLRKSAEANLFSGLSNLQDLDLYYNSLGQLPAEVWANLFSGLSNLQKLNLGVNKLSELPAEVFSGPICSQLTQQLAGSGPVWQLAWAVAC